MPRTKKPIVRPRKVWRMSAEAPQGEIVDSLPGVLSPVLKEEESGPRPPRSQLNWRASSHDLSIGLEVSDFADTLPNDLYDELFEAVGKGSQ
jgi:hypothetical protein